MYGAQCYLHLLVALQGTRATLVVGTGTTMIGASISRTTSLNILSRRIRDLRLCFRFHLFHHLLHSVAK